MTQYISRRRSGLPQALARAAMVSVAATLALTGCSQGASSAAKGGAEALPSAHVHGISRDPGSGKVNLATHEGLNVLQSDGSWKRVGPEVDLMGFAVSAPGTFYASGHPGSGVEMPNPVGLIKSTDAGATWTILSREGLSDFHALTASAKGVMGFDSEGLRITSDGKTWSEGALSVSPTSLAAAPDGARVLAATDQGLLSSTDDGRTWERLVSAPTLALAAFADAKTVVGVTYEGRLAFSADAGLTWRSDLATLARGQALAASRDKAGVLEILVVTDKAVFQSRDNGATLTELTP
jgi:hypothetical protein